MPEGSSSLEEGYKTPKKRTTGLDGNAGSTEADSSVTQDKSPRAMTRRLSFESSLNGSPGGVSISSDDRLVMVLLNIFQDLVVCQVLILVNLQEKKEIKI